MKLEIGCNPHIVHACHFITSLILEFSSMDVRREALEKMETMRDESD